MHNLEEQSTVFYYSVVEPVNQKSYWNSTRDFILPYRALEYDQVRAPPATQHNDFQSMGLAVQKSWRIIEGGEVRGEQASAPVHHPRSSPRDPTPATGAEARAALRHAFHHRTRLRVREVEEK